MENNIDSQKVLSWFSGKALVNAEICLDLLNESIEAGGWIKGASRKVTAGLGKVSVLLKFVKANRGLIDSYKAEGEAKSLLASAVNAAVYGIIGYSTRFDWVAVYAACSTAEQACVVNTIKAWADALSPVAVAIKELDSRRPAPVFTSIGLSPTVTHTLSNMNFSADLSSIVCPDVKKEELIGADGKTVVVMAVQWAPGTVHNSTRFSKHSSCQACGHAIHNCFNWVPLSINSKEGIPHSFWVGRDCAANIFGVKATGELEYSNR